MIYYADRESSDHTSEGDLLKMREELVKARVHAFCDYMLLRYTYEQTKNYMSLHDDMAAKNAIRAGKASWVISEINLHGKIWGGTRSDYIS